MPEVLSIADHARIPAGQKKLSLMAVPALQANPDPRVRQFLDGIADGLFRSAILPAIITLILPELSTHAVKCAGVART